MELKLPDAPDWEMMRRYLGAVDRKTEQTASQLLKKLRSVCTPREIHREFAVERKSDGIYLYGEKLDGEDIKKHLEGCEKCVLFSLTLGVQADALLRMLENSDMSAAVICDALASVLTEQLCDEAQARIKEEYKGMFLTSRYSPGYGDLPLSANRTVAELLDAQKRTGVTVTESYLLLPRKTVTALIGVSEKETKGHLAGCESCKMRDKCTFRREGKSCGSK